MLFPMLLITACSLYLPQVAPHSIFCFVDFSFWTNGGWPHLAQRMKFSPVLSPAAWEDFCHCLVSALNCPDQQLSHWLIPFSCAFYVFSYSEHGHGLLLQMRILCYLLNIILTANSAKVCNSQESSHIIFNDFISRFPESNSPAAEFFSSLDDSPSSTSSCKKGKFLCLLWFRVC